MTPALARLAVATVMALALSVVTGACEEPRRGTAFKVTASAFVGLAAVDVAQTTNCVRDGRCRESNPAMRPFARSPVRLGLVKAAMVSSVLGVAWQARRHHPRRAWLVLGTATAVQGFAVGWNARQLRKAPR